MGAELLSLVAGPLFHVTDVVAGWLLTYLLHSTGWILAAWLISGQRVVRLAPAAQHAVWVVSLAGGFATASLQLSGVTPTMAGAVRLADGAGRHLGALVVNVDRDAAGRETTRFGAVVGPVDPHRGLMQVAPPARGDGTHVSRVTVVRPPLSLLIVALAGLVSAALLARLLWSVRELRLALRWRRDAGDTLAGHALRHLCEQSGVRRRVALSVTEALDAPAAISTSEIALPSRVLAELTPLEQEALLAHELAHVLRRDTLWLRVALLVEAIAWFQPLNHLATRRLRLAAEFAADAWAVRATRQPLRLARALARIAEWLTAARPTMSPLPTVFGAGGSPLLQRVRRLTAAQPSPDPVHAWPATLLLGAVAVSLVAVVPTVSVGAERMERRMLARFVSLSEEQLQSTREVVVRTVRDGARPTDELRLVRIVTAGERPTLSALAQPAAR